MSTAAWLMVRFQAARAPRGPRRGDRRLVAVAGVRRGRAGRGQPRAGAARAPRADRRRRRSRRGPPAARDGDGRDAARPSGAGRRRARAAGRRLATGAYPAGLTFDVITMGRIGVDVYPLQIGVSLREVTSFGKFLGGSSSNVAVAAARYGRRVATITRTGNDPFGEFLHDALRGFGVDDRWVTPVDGLPTPVTFCEIFPPDDFPLYFYREPEGAGPRDPRRRARPRRDPRGEGLLGHGHRPLAGAVAHRHARRAARRAQGITVLDLDYRPMFWSSREEARRVGARGAAATRRRRRQRRRVGDRGTRDRDAASTRSRLRRQARAAAACSPGAATSRVEVPPAPVEVVNGLGAGDAFGGALCHGLLAGWDARAHDALLQRRGRARRRRGSRCADAMPTRTRSRH